MIEHVSNVLGHFRNLSKETRAMANWKNYVWKTRDGKLHLDLVSLTAGSKTTCICAISHSYEKLESFAREMLDLFDAKQLVIHDRCTPVSEVVKSIVSPGHKGGLEFLPNGKCVSQCKHYPSIKGLLRWIHTNKTREHIFNC